MGGDSEETRQSSVRSVLIGGKRLRDDSAGACGWAVTTSRVVAPNVNDIFVFPDVHSEEERSEAFSN
jgi:hypothetical protein